VLRWDGRREDHGKHENFDHLWLGPYKVVAIQGNNSFSLQKGEYFVYFLMKVEKVCLG
jgi:hypothetical protein